MEWGRAASLAYMVGGLFASRDPWECVPERYRPDARPTPSTPGPRVPNEEEARKVRLQIGLANLGELLCPG